MKSARRASDHSAGLNYLSADQVKEFYTLSPDLKLWRCTFCNHTLNTDGVKEEKRGGNTTSIRRHLSKHETEVNARYPPPEPPAKKFKDGTLPNVSPFTQKQVDNAYSVKIFLDKSSFNSVNSPGENEFFNRLFGKFGLSPPNEKIVKNYVINQWSNTGAKGKVRIDAHP